MNKGDCGICGEWRYLQRDHIVPRCKGGGEEASNIQFICYDCHIDKTRVDLATYVHQQHTLEARERIRQSNLGKALSPETRAKLSAAMKGRTFSDEHKAKLKLARQRVVETGKQPPSREP